LNGVADETASTEGFWPTVATAAKEVIIS